MDRQATPAKSFESELPFGPNAGASSYLLARSGSVRDFLF
jgi:hypothetical protein